MLSSASSRFLRGAAATARRLAVAQPVFVGSAGTMASSSSRAFSAIGESATFDLTGSFQVSLDFVVFFVFQAILKTCDFSSVGYHHHSPFFRLLSPSPVSVLSLSSKNHSFVHSFIYA
jgi:hypothetical protein